MFRQTSSTRTPDVFGVDFVTRQGQPVTMQSDLQFRPLRWKAAADGGPQSCDIAVTGTRAGLKSLREWLRYGVTVYTPNGSVCWWGFVHEITVQIDGWAVTLTLETLRNRIAVAYSSLEGAIESAQTTPWADDAGSQSEYGVREHLESIGQATTSMALTYRDALLKRRARPQYSRALAEAGASGATLRCRGWSDVTAWRYWLRTDGRLEHMPTDSELQPIGWSISGSNQIGFGGAAIHDAGGRLAALQQGMKIAVTGSAANNGTFTVADATTEEVGVYSNNSIRFEPSDDILDSWEDMDMVKSDHWLRVQGSTNNSRWHWVANGGPEHVRTSASISGTIVDEGPGPVITLTQPQKMFVASGTAYEVPGMGPSVSITMHGYHIAQRVTLSAAMKIDRVMVEAAKVGSPGDNFELRIYGDSAGSLDAGTQLTAGTLSAALLTDNLTAVWVPVTMVTLAAGSYWIVVRRSGANDGLNYYTVGMTPTAYGTCQMYTGSAWTTHAPGWYLRFRLWAVEDTGVIAETMLAARLQTLALLGGFTSGVNGYPTMDQQATVADELDRLTKIGASGGARVLVDVGQDLTLRLVTQAAANPNETLRLYGVGGRVRITDAAGSPWPAGLLPVGLWAELADMDSDLAGEGGLSPAYMEAVEYSAENGAWTIEFEGERNLLDILKVQAG